MPPLKTDYRINNDFSLVQTAREIFHVQLKVIKYNEPGTRLGIDIEKLHDFRVAIRRMRSALNFFAVVMPESLNKFLTRELSWLGDFTGRVRDLDVNLENLPRIKAMMSDSGDYFFDICSSELNKDRIRARRDLNRILNSKRYIKFIERLEKFTNQTAFSQSTSMLHPAADELLALSNYRLTTRQRKLKKKSRVEKYHSLRKTVKKHRYCCEFFKPLYGKKLNKYLLEMEKIQDILGEHQDAVTACEVLQGYAARFPLRSKAAQAALVSLGELIAQYKFEADRLRMDFWKSWKKFENVKFPI